MIRRGTLAALVAAALALPALAMPLDCVQGHVKVLVPFAVGSINDTLARAVAQRMAPLPGLPLVVESRIGAGGSIAMRMGMP